MMKTACSGYRLNAQKKWAISVVIMMNANMQAVREIRNLCSYISVFGKKKLIATIYRML